MGLESIIIVFFFDPIHTGYQKGPLTGYFELMNGTVLH